MNFEIGQQVEYQYDAHTLRVGEVIEYDEAANRYRVLWTSGTWGNKPLRTWVRAAALTAVKVVA